MARSFNGTSDIITLGTGFALLEPFTFSSWINPSHTSGNDAIVAATATVGGAAEIRYNGAASTAKIEVLRQNAASLVTSASSINLNVWSHVAVTWIHGAQKIYLNGVLDANTGTDATDIVPQAYLFGENQPASSEFFHGSMADNAAWSVALTAAEILSLSKGARPYTIRSASLTGWWPLDGVQSPEPDLSGSKNNGTLTGTAKAFGPPLMPFTPRWPQVNPAPAILQGFPDRIQIQIQMQLVH